MRFDRAQQLADEAVFAHTGTYLSDIEVAVLQGAWQKETYDQIADRLSYTPAYITRVVGPQLWKRLSAALGEPVNKKNFRAALARRQQQQEQPETTPPIPGPGHSPSSKPTAQASSPAALHQADWGAIPDVSTFYGRAEELAVLTGWITQDQCRLVSVLGLGGIGKSVLATRLAQQLQGEFECVVWRSLRNDLPFQDLLADLIAIFSDQQETQADLSRVLHWMRQRRCLIVLDNFETLLQTQEQSGLFRVQCQGYQDLLQQVGGTVHQSCLLLTSREKPLVLNGLAGRAVRSYCLKGASDLALALVQSQAIVGSDQEQRELCDRYDCNPLALNIVATAIRDLFDNRIHAFLQADITVFSSIRHLLEQQFQRLSSLEQTALYWLAINRDWTTIPDLAADIIPPVSKTQLIDALTALKNRSLVETRTEGFGLQSVILEFLSDRLIARLLSELRQNIPADFHRFTLMKTTVAEAVQLSQRRTLVAPLAEQWQPACHPDQFHEVVQYTLSAVRASSQPTSYAPGNLITLCQALQHSLTGYDFSELPIRQADFRHAVMHDVNFAGAIFQQCQFTQPFGAVFALQFSPDQTLLAVGEGDGRIVLWRVADRVPQQTLIHSSDWITGLVFTPDGSILASSGSDAAIRLWDMASGQRLRTLKGHTAPIMEAIAIHPNGQLLVSGSHDCQLCFWDIATGALLAKISHHQNAVRAVAMSPDGNLLATSDQDGTVCLWHPEQRSLLTSWQQPGQVALDLHFSPDSRLLAAGYDNGSVQVWDWQTSQQLYCFTGHTRWVNRVRFTPDGQTVISGSIDHTIKLWHLPTGKLIKTLAHHISGVYTLSLTADGSLLASGSKDRTVKLWDLSRLKLLRTLTGGNY